MIRREITFLTLCFLAAGCNNQDTITTYRLAKEPSTPTATSGAGGSMMANGAMPMLPGMAPAATAKDLQWTVPGGWTAQPPSAMRIGSFLVKGANGQTADVSIVPLSGDAGGDLANINRWRGQIQLSPISDETLAAESEMISPAGRRMRLVDFVSETPLIDSRYKKRLVAAVYTKGQTSWFFKMIGDDETVQAAKPAFLQLLRSLRFNSNA